jgi:hypothetical protein
MFWGTRNPELVAQHVKAATELAEPGFHFADNFFTWARNNSMLDDEAFVTSWTSNVETDADKAIVWRRYIWRARRITACSSMEISSNAAPIPAWV